MTEHAQDPLFTGGGELGRAMAAHDWSATPLGPPGTWPVELRSVVRILLTSRFSMWMAWGPELTMFYNDAYRRDTLRTKHPWALGHPAREVWAEIWDDIGPRIASVLETGEATWDEALMLFLERAGYVEETYHTFSYSPLADGSGAVVGMLCVVSEDTERVIGERRLRILSELGDVSAVTAPTTPEACRAAVEVLSRGRVDVPFSAVYLLEDGAGGPGWPPGTACATTPGSPRSWTGTPIPTGRCGTCCTPGRRSTSRGSPRPTPGPSSRTVPAGGPTRTGPSSCP